MQLVRLILDTDNFRRERIQPARVVTDRLQQRQGFQDQRGGLDDDLGHLLHLRLEAADLEKQDRLPGLVHLIDSIVHAADQILDVGSVERRDEGSAHGGQHLPGDLVRPGLVLEDALAILLDPVAALEQAAQRLGARHDLVAVPHEQVEEALLPGHQHLNQPSIEAS